MRCRVTEAIKMNYLTVFLTLAFILRSLLHCVAAFEVLQTVRGEIGAQNYTHYRISRPGKLLLELKSLKGDVDLYVSSINMKPTLDDYELQSSSCGIDSVEIPISFPRPFGIGVYGHFVHELSAYEVSVILLPPHEELTYEQLTHHYYDYEAADHMFQNHQASDYMYRDVKPTLPPTSKQNHRDSHPAVEDSYGDEDEDVGSVLWQILLTLLKVVFEVIL